MAERSSFTGTLPRPIRQTTVSTAWFLLPFRFMCEEAKKNGFSVTVIDGHNSLVIPLRYPEVSIDKFVYRPLTVH